MPGLDPLASRPPRISAPMAHPRFYDAVQRGVGWPRVWRWFVAEVLRPHAGMRLLDVGCGTAELLAHLPSGSYLGVDPDRAHVDVARRRHGARGRFRVGDVASVDPALDGPFDAVLALGVLHHLDDTAAADLLAASARALAPGGRLLTLDGCRAPGQTSLARWLLDRDRGRHVRDAAGYEALIRPHLPVLRSARHDGRLRVPYSLLVVEARRG